MSKLYAIEFTEQEVRAIGLAIAAFKHGDQLAVLGALAAADHGVLDANIRSVCLKFLPIEEEISPDGWPPRLPDHDEIVARSRASLDQQFAALKDAGREELYPKGGDDDAA